MDKKTAKQNFSDEITFKFVSDSVLKAFEEDGKKFCRLTASSNGDDLVGDVMSEKALKQMKGAAVGTVMFMNHSTNVPEDVFGAVVETDLEKKSADLVGGGTGELLCLDYLVEVEDSNDRAVKCWQMIQSGKKLGASVTVLVRSKKPNPKIKGGIIIDDVEYLETSIVGIPCNRQSWVSAAQKSIDLAVKRLAKNADEPLETEGETEMETENLEAVTETEKNQVVVIGAGSTGINVKQYFPRTAETIVKIKNWQEKITKGESVENSVEGLPIVKGLFNDILNQEPRFWELCDILCNVKWQLSWQISNLKQLGQTDFSAIEALWGEAIDEFKAAQIKSFAFWEEIGVTEVEDDDLLEMSLQLEKALQNLSEVEDKPSAENSLPTVQEVGSRIVELAKSLKLIPDSESAATELIPNDEQIKKSQVYQDLSLELENSQRENSTLQTKLEETESDLEIAKAGLTVANEALRADLRQPLVAAQGTSASS